MSGRPLGAVVEDSDRFDFMGPATKPSLVKDWDIVGSAVFMLDLKEMCRAG